MTVGVIDIESGRPACVLLAAAFRSDRRVCHLFDPSEWLTGPTDGMRKIDATLEEWGGVREARPGAAHRSAGAAARKGGNGAEQ